MNEYRIKFSYIGTDGRRRTNTDSAAAFTSCEAVKLVEEEYSNLNGLRIEEVLVDRNNRWEIIEAWKL